MTTDSSSGSGSGSRRFGGRPRLRTAKRGERVHLGVLVTREMKKRLETASRETGRSQSQEAEIRLEKSFYRQDSLTELTEISGKLAELQRILEGARIEPRERKDSPNEGLQAQAKHALS